MNTVEAHDDFAARSSVIAKNDDIKRFILFQNEKCRIKTGSIASVSVLQTSNENDQNIREFGGKSLKQLILLDNIRIQKRLYNGTFARVFKGHLNGKAVVLKVIHPTISKNFVEERDLLAECQSKRVVELYASLLEFNIMAPVLVMEYCKGSLKQVYSEPVSHILTSKFLRQIVEGIEHIHSKGIIHLDIKLENLLLKECGDVVIADFGFAERTEQVTNRTTILKGTPGYMDYQSLNKEKPSKATDIFAIACVFVKLLSGNDFILCSTETLNFYSADEGESFVQFYKNMFVLGRPEDDNPSYKEKLEDRLKKLFQSCVHPSQTCLYQTCFDMLQPDATLRPTARDILNSEVLKSLIMDTNDHERSMWVPYTPLIDDGSPLKQIPRIPFHEDKLRIMSSFGFSKVFADICSIFYSQTVRSSNLLAQLLDINSRESDNKARTAPPSRTEAIVGPHVVAKTNENIISNQPRVMFEDSNPRAQGNFPVSSGLANISQQQPNSSNLVNEFVTIVQPTTQQKRMTSNSTETTTFIRPRVPNRNGRPRGSYKHFPEIRQEGSTFHCTMCTGYQTESRNAVLKHRRKHLRERTGNV